MYLITASVEISDDVEVIIQLKNTYPIYIFHVIHSYNDNNRVPVAHAKVSWFKLSDTEDEYLWYETVTDDNGIYSIALADGIYNLYLDGEFFLQIEVKGGPVV